MYGKKAIAIFVIHLPQLALHDTYRLNDAIS